MIVNAPQPVADAIAPLFERLPLDKAMEALVVESEPADDLVALVERVCSHSAIAGRERLKAGLWLYVDALDRSHTISQGMQDSTGSFWHGIMHRREGDFSNSHYWFSRTGNHPAMKDIPGYDGHAFVDAVATRYKDRPSDLVELQRSEWVALFAWCACG